MGCMTTKDDGAMDFKNVDLDITTYNQVELGARYTSTAGSQAGVDPAVLDDLEARLLRDGYVIIERLIDAATCDAIAADVRPRFVHSGGRNNFEGHKTRRLYAVPEKTFVCNPLAEHPLVLGLLDRLLMPNYLLSQLQVIDIMPGEARQPAHHDDGFYPVPRPRKALSAASIFAIDDFTAENGATWFVPGSHRWGDRLPSAEDPVVPAVMPRGSMLFFLGTLWHGGGANRSDAPRLCVTAQYCEPWLRPQENYWLSVSKARAAQCSPHMQRLLGYSIHRPFAGMVDGMHPRRLLEGPAPSS